MNKINNNKEVLIPEVMIPRTNSIGRSVESSKGNKISLHKHFTRKSLTNNVTLNKTYHIHRPESNGDTAGDGIIYVLFILPVEIIINVVMFSGKIIFFIGLFIYNILAWIIERVIGFMPGNNWGGRYEE